MFRNYIILGIRNILKERTHSFINLIGLVIGLTAFFTISLYVFYEKNYDTHSKKGEITYRINLLETKNGIPGYKTALNFSALAPEIKNSYKEVTDYCRLFSMQSSFIRAISLEDKDKNTLTYNEDHLYYADPSFFDFFPFTLREGIGKELENPFKAYLTEETANKYFGKSNPIGKTITFQHSNGQQEFTIVGVFQLPKNTHLNIHILFSYSSLKYGSLSKEAYTNWVNEQTFTYIQLDRNTLKQDFEEKLAKFIMQKPDIRPDIQFELQSIRDIHTGSSYLDEPKPTVNIGNLNLLLAAAILILILILAAFNYINITIGNSSKRIKEVSLRILSGAEKGQVFTQFTTQFLLFSCFSLCLAALLSYQVEIISLEELSPKFLILLACIALLTILITSIYPAFLLVIKGSELTKKETKKSVAALVPILQFTLCILLLISTLTIHHQLSYMKNSRLGIDIDNTFVVKGPALLDHSKSDAALRSMSFRDYLNEDPRISSVTYSGVIPGTENSWIVGAKRDPTSLQEIDLTFNIINDNFFDVFNVELLAGRNFKATDQRKRRFGEEIEQMILSASAVKELGYSNYEQAIGSILTVSNKKCKIIGVINDFHQQSLQFSIRPAAYFLDKNASLYFSIKPIEFDDQSQVNPDMIDDIKASFSDFFPGNPFEYFVLKDFYESQYQKEERIFDLFFILSVLSITLAGSGLLSMSIQLSLKRIKEIGIRKVNGAKISEILALLNKDFVKWVLIAFIIATPISWYAMHKWLENFAYKTELSWWIFALAGIIALGIALITVSWQSWKAATRNPVEALRYE